MPGPGHRNKKKGKPKPKEKSQGPSDNPLLEATPSQCHTLDEDEITRCDQPATEGYPHPERCKVHQEQYRTMYMKYKEAAKLVDEVKQSDSIPSEGQIERYANLDKVLIKIKYVRKYIESIRIEKTGRDLHGRRFFLKIDDGHKRRLKLLEKEMIRANGTIRALESRAYKLYIQANPIPEWAKVTQSDTDGKGPCSSVEEFLDSLAAFEPSRTLSATEDLGKEDADLIDMTLRARKLRFVDSILFLLGCDGVVNEDDPEKDELRRHYGPELPMAIDKVSFEDFLLGADFSLEDGFKIYKMTLQFSLGFGLMWMKDAVIEALSMAKSGLLDNAANVGNLKSRIKILGGWIYNVPHSGTISDKTWHMLIHIVNPPANVENRFVRLCNTYDDMISFLTFVAFGAVPRPTFCKDAWAYRNTLSMSGIIIADTLPGEGIIPPDPIPTSRKPRKTGNIVWAEFERRGYLFGAIRMGPDPFTDDFLNRLKARPDLFNILIRSDNDPGRKVEMFGDGPSNALPVIRARFTECPREGSGRPPSLIYRETHGDWEVHYSAKDILYSENPEMLGYLTKIERGNPTASGQFFRFKKFPVRYIAIIDPIPNRPFTMLIQNVAWAALCAQGYGNGNYDYDERRYAIASDKLFAKRVEERLAFLPDEKKTFNRMEDDL